jgi:O-6-methylguanine DNA methyltransferase
LIQKIPHGETRTYRDLALQIDNIRLNRAVGQACKKNPLVLIIPCHRIVGKNCIGVCGRSKDQRKAFITRTKNVVKKKLKNNFYRPSKIILAAYSESAG